MTWPTEYLIEHGWKPSPTTWSAEGGWEHFQLSGVPRVYGQSQGTYSDCAMRLTTSHALSVQLAIDSILEEDLRSRLSWAGVLFEAAQLTAKTMRFVGGRRA